MARRRLINYHPHGGYRPEVIHSADLVSVRATCSGFLQCVVRPGQRVKEGELLARILDPYECYVRAQLKAPVSGVVAFAGDEPMVYENTAVLKLIHEEM